MLSGDVLCGEGLKSVGGRGQGDGTRTVPLYCPAMTERYDTRPIEEKWRRRGGTSVAEWTRPSRQTSSTAETVPVTVASRSPRRSRRKYIMGDALYRRERMDAAKR